MVTLYWIAAILFIALGLAGTIVPFLPGAPLVFIGLVLAASIDGFQQVGWWTLAFCAVLTALSVAIDHISGAVGAKKVGASKLAIFGSVVGSIVGIFFGFIGLLIGPFIGAAVGEYIHRKDFQQAGKAGIGTWIGFVLGTALKIGIVFTMIGVCVAMYVL